ARFILLPRFEPGVGDDIEAEGIAVEVRRLPGIADEEADVIDTTQGESVFGGHGSLVVTNGTNFWLVGYQVIFSILRVGQSRDAGRLAVDGVHVSAMRAGCQHLGKVDEASVV